MHQLLRYVAIGGSTASIYLAVALGTARAFGTTPPLASLSGFAAALPFSYLGHKRLTFRSAGAHRDELPRFIAAAAAGLAICVWVPDLAVRRWHSSPGCGYFLACVAVPTFNYLVMRLWVFVAAVAAPARGR